MPTTGRVNVGCHSLLGIRLLAETRRRPDQIDRAKQKSHGLGLFVRSLVGLDRGAATLLRVRATAVAA
jgi:hypothetical protein